MVLLSKKGKAGTARSFKFRFRSTSLQCLGNARKPAAQEVRNFLRAVLAKRQRHPATLKGHSVKLPPRVH